MEDLSIFLESLNKDVYNDFPSGTIGHRAKFHVLQGELPEVVAKSLVIIGCPECRRSRSNISVSGLTKLRMSFYRLSDHFQELNIVDLGNILPGNSVDDTYFALSSAVAQVIKANSTVLILGGGQDLTYANYLAYQKNEQVVNVVNVDSRFDIGNVEDEISSERFLHRIVLHQPNILFNFSNLAYQSYYTNPSELELMRKMYFDSYRLGEVQSHLDETEPIIRTADLISFDLTSIRSSDFKSNHKSEPNGLYGEEACAICRYAGLSDKLTSFGIYECSEEFADSENSLVGQMMWYLAWGVANRKQDYPFSDRSDNVKYTVSIEQGQYDIVFYKSPRSDRWWMEVPYPNKRGDKYERHFMVPCSYADYTMACANEMPDRWWQTYQKLG